MAQVLKKAAEKKELVQVALNTHGTRAVQKLIETLTTREQARTLFHSYCHSCLLMLNQPHETHMPRAAFLSYCTPLVQQCGYPHAELKL